MKITKAEKTIKKWTTFFENNDKNNLLFIAMLKKYDKWPLTTPLHKTIEDFEYTENGLIDNDIRKIATAIEDYDFTPEKTRIAISIYYNCDYTYLIKTYKNNMIKIIENSLLFGDYEKYGITYETLLEKAVQKKIISKDKIIELSLLRGLFLGKTEKEITKKEIIFNKIKIFLYWIFN
jgi:hypothetical protein